MLMGAGSSWSCFVSPTVIVVLRGSTRRGGSGWPAACRARCVGARSSEPTGSPEESKCLEAPTALWQPIDLRGDMPSQTPTAAFASPMGANASTIARAKAVAVAVGVLVLPSWASIEAPRGRERCAAAVGFAPRRGLESCPPEADPCPSLGATAPAAALCRTSSQMRLRKCPPETAYRTSVGYRVYVPLSCSRCVWSYRAHSATPLGWWRLGLSRLRSSAFGAVTGRENKPTPARKNNAPLDACTPSYETRDRFNNIYTTGRGSRAGGGCANVRTFHHK
eukprot:scaffold44141_cov56-Phaeocystis_antarctica.AAC.1